MPNEAIDLPAGLTTNGLLGKRYMARFIDSFILSLTFIGLLALAGAIKANGASEILFQIGIGLILWAGYGAAYESSAWQATLGKRLMGLRVYNTRGERLAPVHAAGRNLVKEGPFIVLAFLPGGNLLAVIWLGAHLAVMYRSPVYQAIHDRVARTLVAAPEETTQLGLA